MKILTFQLLNKTGNSVFRYLFIIIQEIISSMFYIFQLNQTASLIKLLCQTIKVIDLIIKIKSKKSLLFCEIFHLNKHLSFKKCRSVSRESSNIPHVLERNFAKAIEIDIKRK